MYVRACVRACACLIAFLVRVIKRTFERDGNFTERERERERERARRKDFFRFFISFFVLSCLCLVFVFENLPLERRRQGEKDGIIPHQKKEGCAGPFRSVKRKKNNPLVVKSVKASVRSPLNDLAHREPQQHGSSCRRNLHLRAS